MALAVFTVVACAGREKTGDRATETVKYLRRNTDMPGVRVLHFWGSGGATGIRTLETVSRLHTFQACAFDHSATAPVGGV